MSREQPVEPAPDPRRAALQAVLNDIRTSTEGLRYETIEQVIAALAAPIEVLVPRPEPTTTTTKLHGTDASSWIVDEANAGYVTERSGEGVQPPAIEDPAIVALVETVSRALNLCHEYIKDHAEGSTLRHHRDIFGRAVRALTELAETPRASLRNALAEMVLVFGPHAVRPPALTAVTNARAALSGVEPRPQDRQEGDAGKPVTDLGEIKDRLVARLRKPVDPGDIGAPYFPSDYK